jgi:excisionase family DNA binding protein
MQTTTERTPLLLTKEQVAELTGLGVRTVERLTARGVLRGVRPAGMRCVRYRREDVEDWVRRGCPGR